LEVAQLDLHHLRAKQPVQAMEMRIDGVGMHEAVPLSDPADRVSALVLAGINCQLNGACVRHARSKCRASTISCHCPALGSGFASPSTSFMIPAIQ
jgi:hypothetical protein